MCDTMGGEGGSKGGRKTGGGRKPLFAFLSRFYFQCEEIPRTSRKWNVGQNRGHGGGFLVVCIRPDLSGGRPFLHYCERIRTRCGLFALSGALTAPNCRFKHPDSKIHAKGRKIEI